MNSTRKATHRHFHALWFVALAFLLVMFSGAAADDALLQVRFANPRLDCEAGIYCLDVEFQSDVSNKELFGMNVRFFYQGNMLSFIDFAEFEGGYGPFTPSPPQVRPGNDNSGPALFGFDGPAVYVNGAIQLVDYGAAPLYVAVSDWTKLFSVRFAVSDPDALNGAPFCPSVFWDLESAPEKGGLLRGSNGVVMTVVAEPPMESATVERGVVQFNGKYDESLAGTVLYPETSACVTTDCEGETPEEDDPAEGETPAEGESPEGGDEEDSPDDAVSEGEQGQGDDDETDNIEGESAEGESDEGGDAGEEVEEDESGEEDAAPVVGCAGCSVFQEKSLRDSLGDWLLIGISMLVLLGAAEFKRRY